jgi:glutathione S-transferase
VERFQARKLCSEHFETTEKKDIQKEDGISTRSGYQQSQLNFYSTRSKKKIIRNHQTPPNTNNGYHRNQQRLWVAYSSSTFPSPLLTSVNSYVLLAAVSTFLVGTWQGMRVGTFRKSAKIPYPFEYASYEQVQTASPASSQAMILFNSAQRAHQNFNENHGIAVAAMMIAGLKNPVATAVLGAVWSVNRVIYAVGYTNGSEGGKGRYYGIAWMFAHFGLIGMAGKAAWDIARS